MARLIRYTGEEYFGDSSLIALLQKHGAEVNGYDYLDVTVGSAKAALASDTVSETDKNVLRRLLADHQTDAKDADEDESLVTLGLP